MGEGGRRCARTDSGLVYDERGRAPVGVIAPIEGRDPYDPAEGRCQLTHRQLEALRDAGLSALVVTGSDRVLRDLPLLAEIARHSSATVLVRVATVDPELAALWEAESPPPDRRLAVLRPLGEAGIAAGLLASPLVPFLMDGHGQLRALLSSASQAGARFFLTGAMSMKGDSSRRRVQQLFAERWPYLLGPLRDLYGDSPCPPVAYTDRIAADARRIGIMVGLADHIPGSWSPAGLLHAAFVDRITSSCM